MNYLKQVTKKIIIAFSATLLLLLPLLTGIGVSTVFAETIRYNETDRGYFTLDDTLIVYVTDASQYNDYFLCLDTTWGGTSCANGQISKGQGTIPAPKFNSQALGSKGVDVFYRKSGKPDVGRYGSADFEFLVKSSSGSDDNSTTSGDVKFDITEASVAAGGAVRFTITNAPSGAIYCIHTLAGHCSEWVSGQTIDQDGKASGSFTIDKSENQSTTSSINRPYVVSLKLSNGTVRTAADDDIVEVKPAQTKTDENDDVIGGNEEARQMCPEAFKEPVIELPRDASKNPNCVKLVQRELFLTPDGIYDTALTQAVKEYQTEAGFLPEKCRDGKVGPQTWSAILGTEYPNTHTDCYNPTSTTTDTDKDSDGTKTGTGSVLQDDGSMTVNGQNICQLQGLVAHKGLCLPPQQFKGKGLVSCTSIGDCARMVINLSLITAGVFAVLFIIIGGFQYITSHGNEEQATKGRKTLTYALIGLAMIVLAYTLVRVVFNTLISGPLG